MRNNARDCTRRCPTCQKFKKQKIKHGHLPPKEDVEDTPWDRLCVDLIGKYTIDRGKAYEPLTMQAVTMIDPATGWFEIAPFPDKQSITVANVVKQTWLTRCPSPTLIAYDRGSEFIGHEFKSMIQNDCGVKCRPIAVRNPQSNATIERVHQVLGNMARTFNLQENQVEDDDPWPGILAATAYAIQSTYHTTLGATPGQLIFGRDMVFNLKHVADWHAVGQRKRERMRRNDRQENRTRVPHNCHAGDDALLRCFQARKLECPHRGPCEVIEAHDDGTVTLQTGAVQQRINVRGVTPCRT